MISTTQAGTAASPQRAAARHTPHHTLTCKMR